MNYFLDHLEPGEAAQSCTKDASLCGPILVPCRSFNIRHFILKCLDVLNLTASLEHSSTCKIHEPVFPHSKQSKPLFIKAAQWVIQQISV